MAKIIFILFAVYTALVSAPYTIEKSTPTQPIKIAFICAPSVIGKYSQSTYNVALSTLMGVRRENFSLIRYTLKDESSESLSTEIEKAKKEGIDAFIAPLTSTGAKNIIALDINKPIFIPTVHKRDFPSAPDNFVFGGIDYLAQIEALLPYMNESIAIFYDNSNVGMQLKAMTEEVFAKHKSQKKKVKTFPVDLKGDNIVTHLSKPSLLSKSSVIVHLPVVKSAMLTAHMTFTGVKERNILSTQINVDPALITLTQYHDRKNIIIANSIIEFPPMILQSNDLMNNDIMYDWIHYSTSVGIDYLISALQNSPREYSMRIIHSQVIYPIELVSPKEFSFEPL